METSHPPVFTRASTAILERPSTTTVHQLVFTGSGWEYFKIWLVNVALSILTLGIYSAWAKVRREKYFHNHTILAGAAFDYTAKPLSILKGRLLVLGVIVLFSLVSAAFPVANMVLVVLIVLLLPWLITTAIKFRARYTAYRNLHFSFLGTPARSFLYFLVWKVAGYLSLGALLPLAKQRERRYVVGNLAYGGSTFSCNPGVKAFYRAYLTIIAIVSAPLAVAIAAFVLRSAAAAFFDDAENPVLQLITGSLGAFIMILGGLLAIVISVFSAGLLRIMLAKVTWNETGLGYFQFCYSIRVSRYAWIVSSNMLLRVLTLGLATPWCAVRLHRYRVENFSVTGPANFSQFVSTLEQEMRAFAEQVSDVYNLDIDLGL